MEVKINGEAKEIKSGLSLEGLVLDLSLNKENIAIEVNGEIISKKNYKDYYLKERDILEVVSFVGGG